MPTRTSLLLQPNRPLRLDAARHAQLCIESGIVWITVNGAAGDLFLAAGESYRVPCAGRVVVEAVRGAARVNLARRGQLSMTALVKRWRGLLAGVVAQH